MNRKFNLIPQKSITLDQSENTIMWQVYILKTTHKDLKIDLRHTKTLDN